MATSNKLTSDGSRPVFKFFKDGLRFCFVFPVFVSTNPPTLAECFQFLPRHVQFLNRSTREIDRFLMEIGSPETTVCCKQMGIGEKEG